jgi:PAS domain S-box-containing protein
MHLISEELRLDEIIERVLPTAVTCARAEQGALLLERGGGLELVGVADVRTTTVFIQAPVPLVEAGAWVPVTLVEHAAQEQIAVMLEDVGADPRWGHDPYFATSTRPSVLCMPIARHGEFLGLLLLEGCHAGEMFSNDRLAVLRMLSSQAANVLDHTRLYEALQRSEASFRSLLDGLPDIVVLLDHRGTIEFVNHLGDFPSDRASFVGMDGATLMGPSNAPRWRAAFERVLETGERQELEVEIELFGAPRWFNVRLVANQFGGRVGKVMSISTDITRRKLHERERLKLEMQLRQRQRLESIGTLASGVAHEINNPVQGIMNYAELLLSQPDDPTVVEEFGQEILVESERVAAIVRNLLAFSRQELGEESVPRALEELVESTLTLFRSVVRRDHIELAIEIPPELWVSCRPQQIQQVVMNLVSNARDAINARHGNEFGAGSDSTEARTITIRGSSLERDGRAFVCLSVEDRGTGISEELRARIFDPFFTTKGRDQGTGLGLAVSHGIAVDHGGDLWVESELGRGSTFHLELPAIAPAET